MSETPPEFDLKFLPDWLKESANPQKYANYEGERGGGRSGYDRGERRGPRPGGPGGPGGRRGPGGRPDSRGPRPASPGGPGGPQNRGPRSDRPSGPGGDRGRRDDRGHGPRRDDRERQFRPPPAPPANVRVEFIPEPNAAISIARQIKQSGRAYPLFGTGRLFMDRPERHRVRITSLDPAVPLYQQDDGPVSFERESLERNAFRAAREKFYQEETIEGEPIKGNYSNVARLRSSGVLLGPTNYHAYQPTLRRIYEERYSRRMSFPEFVHTEVEVVSDEQTINDWKEKARSTTTYTTTLEPEPIVFKSVHEAEQHFRQTYLPQLITSGTTLECSGQASRNFPDRSLTNAVRDAWERERAFPVGLVNHLRPALLEAGLHFFKHRKRILYISAIKPVRQPTGHAMSTSIEAIIKAIEASPRCTRRDLALKVLGEHSDAPEMAEQKAALARDFHYLAHSGHVIEFHDGAIDLPLVPGPGPHAKGDKGAGAKSTAPEGSPDIERDAEQAALAEASVPRETGKRTDPTPRPRPVYQPGPRRPAAPPAVEPAVPSEGAAPAVSDSLSGLSDPSASLPVEEIASSPIEPISPPTSEFTASGDLPEPASITHTSAAPEIQSFGEIDPQPAAQLPIGIVTEPVQFSGTLESAGSALPTASFLADESYEGAPQESAPAVLHDLASGIPEVQPPPVEGHPQEIPSEEASSTPPL